jgi:hypothetical protein
VTVLLSWIFLGQVPSEYYYIGGAAVIVGLLALVALQYTELKARDALEATKDEETTGHLPLLGVPMDTGSSGGSGSLGRLQ